MSMWWEGYHGQGLALSEKEFDVFLERYSASHERIRYDVSDEDISDIPFFTEDGREFRFFYVGDDADGFNLIPYHVDGKLNKDWDSNEAFYRKNAYVLTAERPIDGPGCFENPAYASYGEFVEEFKDKLKGYLPNDFDWDAHIGIYSYAAYA